MRAYELAKELNLSSKDLMDLLGRLKVVVKSHSSSLDEGTVRRIREHVAAFGTRVTPAPAPPSRPEMKTPTGERILSVRKITPPPPPPVEEAAVVSAAAADAATSAAPREVRPAREPVMREAGLERPAAKAPAAPAPASAQPSTSAAVAPSTRTRPAETPGPIRIAPVKPPSREAMRDTLTPEEIERQLFGPAPPATEVPLPQPPTGQPVQPPVPTPAPTKRPERRLPPPPPPRRFHAERRPRRQEPKVQEVVAPEAAPTGPKEIELIGAVAVGDLAAKLHLNVSDIMRRLIEFGVLAGINQQLPLDVSVRVAESFGSQVRHPKTEAAGEVAAAPRRAAAPTEEGAVSRPPIVTVMGHVDHGKTSLLDAIRATTVAAGEFGGITQHIGASRVDVDGRQIVFIDTPGHEAFTALRARGAQVTDIAVLVVAADDGVMPQTIEAINHAKAAGVPVIVAVNKIDLAQSNPDRVKQQLSDLGLVPEAWGGDTVMVDVSARQRTGLRELQEMILLVADLHELRANPDKPAKGTVLEAKLDRGRGPVATVLVQEGTLRVGDSAVAGEVVGRVRALMDERGQRVNEAGPSMPVEVLGLEAVPNAGDLLEVVRDERLAKAVGEERVERRRAAETLTRPGIMEEVTPEGRRELRLIIKGDVHGSVEALQASLGRLSISAVPPTILQVQSGQSRLIQPVTPTGEGVGLSILHTGVGPINESDVMLAAASRAIIVGFNVRPEAAVRKLAEQEKVDVRLYRIIYEALDDISKLMRGMLAPKMEEVVLGQAEVRQIFSISKIGTIAGCYVTSGRILRAAGARLLREGTVVYEGKIGSLRRFKDDAREVTEGFECGIGLERFNDVKVGDIIEAYQVQEVPA